jgi:glycosyltransferase involved in cell wall biosynthesis
MDESVREAAKGMDVSIVLPAHNEEEVIGRAVAEATSACERLFGGHEIVVVDDGSSDTTASIVRELSREDPRVRLISHGRNRGYGEALRTGFLASRLGYVFFTDGDLQFDLDELELLLPYVGTVDVIVGYRRQRQDPWSRRAAAWGWNRLMRLMFFVPVRDIDCAFKLFPQKVLADFDIESVGLLVNTELMVKLGRSGYSVVEVGVTHRPRPAGESSVANPRVVLKAIAELLRMRRKLSAFEPRTR